MIDIARMVIVICMVASAYWSAARPSAGNVAIASLVAITGTLTLIVTRQGSWP